MPWSRLPRPSTGRGGPPSAGTTHRQSLPSWRQQRNASRKPPARPVEKEAGAGTNGCRTPWPGAPEGCTGGSKGGPRPPRLLSRICRPRLKGGRRRRSARGPG
eukprot:7855033-Lingulodinium_polyedra.AAC.1